jgi:uncharacterized membrane protein
MKKFLYISSSLFIILVITNSCYYDKEEVLYPGSGVISCTGVAAKFSTDVKPLMQSKCATAGCHNAASTAGGVVLETYVQIAGKATRINQRCVVEKSMPPGAPLNPTEIAIIKCWIVAGAPNN